MVFIEISDVLFISTKYYFKFIRFRNMVSNASEKSNEVKFDIWED